MGDEREVKRHNLEEEKPDTSRVSGLSLSTSADSWGRKIITVLNTPRVFRHLYIKYKTCKSRLLFPS